MRVVYDYGIHRSPPAPARSGQETKQIPVIVIRAGSNNTDSSGIDVSNTDYRLTISPDAIARNKEVRGHERAHLMALGGYAASSIMYDTRTGPGGETVAVGGRIAIDMAQVPGDPRATLQKARTIYTAATAPGNPSAADMRVAAEAYRLMQSAEEEMDASREVHIAREA